MRKPNRSEREMAMTKIMDGNVERYLKRLFLEEFAKNPNRLSGQNETAPVNRDILEQSFRLEEADVE